MAKLAPTRFSQFMVQLIDSTGDTAGLGVLVGDHEILTCAHVVNRALHRDQHEHNRPDDGELVNVKFPLLHGAVWRGQARVRIWLAPPNRDGADGKDVAGLELTTELPEGAGPAKLARNVQPGWIVDVFGYPEARPLGGWVEAVIRHEVAGGRLQLDATTGAALQVQPGFSGSPVCDRHSGHVVGLLCMAPRAGSGERDSYAISSERLRAAWPDVLADGRRESGGVTADLFAADWAMLASDVQDYREYFAGPLFGRDWLMAEIETFCREHDRGYFVIEGDAGMGKTAFASWLARRKQYAAHLTQLDQDAATTAVAVRNLSAQLIAAWDLDDLVPTGALPSNAGSARWLRTVAHAAARRRDAVVPGMPIVLVVDALDAAAEHPAGHMPLGLPDSGQLPAGVYVVVTARTGGLRYTPEGCVRRSLDGAQEENLADLRHYLNWSASTDSIAAATARAGITSEQFIDLLVDRSLGVWIYVRYVLEQIREDPQSACELPGLPRGLEAWYHNNLARLIDGPDGTKLYLPLLATLTVIPEPLPARTLAALAGITDEPQAERSLDHALRPYCTVVRLPTETRSRFEVRHPSLREYFTDSFPAPAIDAESSTAEAQIADVPSLRERLAGASRDAHNRVCDRYLTAWGGLDQQLEELDTNPELGGMDNSYALRWLTWHLLAANREADLHHLLACGPQGQNTWFAAHDRIGDLTGYLRDVGRARNSTQQLGQQLRYALIEASVASLSTTIPSALIGELVSRKLWKASRAFSYIERMTDDHQQAQALACIACELRGERELLSRALFITLNHRQPENRAIGLEALIPYLPSDLLERCIDAVLGIMNDSPDMSLGSLMALAARLSAQLLAELPSRAGTRTPSRSTRDEQRIFDGLFVRDTWIRNSKDAYVWAAVTLFNNESNSEGPYEALAVAGELDNGYDRALLLAALLPYLPPDAFDSVLDLLRSTADSSACDEPFIALAKHAHAGRLGDLLEFAAENWIPVAEFFRHLLPRLAAQHTPAALQLCQKVRRENDRALAFAAIVPSLDAGQAQMLLAPLPPAEFPRRDEPRRPLRPAILAPHPGQEACAGKLQGDYSHGFAVTDFLGLRDHEYQYFVIGVLLDRLPNDVARAAVTELIMPRIDEQSQGFVPAELRLFKRKKALASAAPYLAAEQRRSLLAEIFMAMSFTASDAESEAPFLARFAPFSEREVTEAFAALENAHPITWWPESALMMADVLTHCVRTKTLETILTCVMRLPAEQECFTALAALGQLQLGTVRDDIAIQALGITARIDNPRHKARAVAELAPILLREDLATRAFSIVEPVGPFAGVWAMDAMADVLPPRLLRAAVENVAFAHPAEHVPRVLARLAAEGQTTVIDSVLPRPTQHSAVERMAPLLTASQARRIWSMWDRKNVTDDKAQGLAALIAGLPEDERAAAADEILAAYPPTSPWGGRSDARVLSRLVQVTSTEQLIRRLHELLERRGIVLEWVMEELASVLPGTLIETAVQRALSADDDISCQALAILAPRLSGSLLNRAIIHVADMRYYGCWRAAALAALALQLPHGREERKIMLEKALEARPSLPETMVGLIPHLPERLRPQAIRAAAERVCSELRYNRRTRGENFDTLNALLAVLRDPELESLYVQLREEVQAPHVRVHAQAAVIRQAGSRDASSFFANGQPLYQDWPGESDRAGLMELIAAAEWWIHEHGEDADIDEVVQAIFDVARWWP